MHGYKFNKLGTDDYVRDTKRVRENAREWLRRAVEAAEAGNYENAGHILATQKIIPAIPARAE